MVHLQNVAETEAFLSLSDAISASLDTHQLQLLKLLATVGFCMYCGSLVGHLLCCVVAVFNWSIKLHI